MDEDFDEYEHPVGQMCVSDFFVVAFGCLEGILDTASQACHQIEMIFVRQSNYRADRRRFAREATADIERMTGGK